MTSDAQSPFVGALFGFPAGSFMAAGLRMSWSISEDESPVQATTTRGSKAMLQT